MFGTYEILKAFPDAKVVSTAQTAYLITASKDEKLAVWADKLKDDQPEKLIIPQALEQHSLEIEGQHILIKQDIHDSAHSFVWIPSLKTALGGISVSYDAHLWMLDTQGVKGIEFWVSQIEKIQSLSPEYVIPAHFAETDFSPKHLKWIKDYLLVFKKAVEESQDANQVVDTLLEKYPNLPDVDTLKMSAQVFKGELKWQLASPYLPIEQTLNVDFGQMQFNLTFTDHKNMTFVGTDGLASIDATDHVQYTPIEISKNVFLVYWSEPKSKANVVHVQDFNRNIVYTNISAPNSPFANLKGKMNGVSNACVEVDTQALTSIYPAIGRVLSVDFRQMKFDLSFIDHQKMSFVGAGTATVSTDQVLYTAVEVSKNVFMVYWNEPKTNTNVVHIQDYNHNTVLTNIATSDNAFVHLSGSMQLK